MILIVSDGLLDYGGFASLAHKFYLKYRESYDVTLLHFLIHGETLPTTDEVNYCRIFRFRLPSGPIPVNDLIDPSDLLRLHPILTKKYSCTVATSPASLYLASLVFPGNKMIYFRGGFSLQDSLVPHLGDRAVDSVDESLIIKYVNRGTTAFENVAFQSGAEIRVILSSHMGEYIFRLLTRHNVYVQNPTTTVEGVMPLAYISSSGTGNYEDQIRRVRNKDFDLVFVVSAHGRPMKNSELALSIFRRLTELRKVVIGKGSQEMFTDCQNLMTYEFLPNTSVQEILSRSKVIIIPSCMDVGPEVFYEGIVNGCIPIISRGCGFSRYVTDRYRVDTFDIEVWCQRILSHLKEGFNPDDFETVGHLIIDSSLHFDRLLA